MNEIKKFQAVYVDSGDRYCQSEYNRILKENNGKSSRVWCWKNDHTSVMIAILNGNEAIDNIEIKISDLVCGDNVIPASCIKPAFIREVKAYTGHAGWYADNLLSSMPSGKREFYPEVIYSSAPVPLDKNQLKLIWVDISVGEDTAAGIYKGQITVTDGSFSETLKIEAEILDISMPSPQNYLFDAEYWSHPYNVAYFYGVDPFSHEHIEILKQHMLLYKSLGGHAITASITEDAWGGQTYGGGNDIHYPSMIKWIKKENGEWEFDYTHFDKWVELNKSIGIADKVVCYSMMPWKNIIRYYNIKSGKSETLTASPDTANEYQSAWKPFLNDFAAHLDEKGWFDSIYMGFDERHNMQTALDLASSVKNKDGHTFKISASFNDFIHNQLVFDRLDYASVGLQEIRDNTEEFKKQVIKRRAEDKQTTMYTATEHVPNSFTKSFPAESYWSVLYAGKMNSTGFLRWAYDAWVKNPLDESTHWSFPAGDCFLVYPSERNEAVKESKISIRLAKLDEGVRDVNKLYILRQKFPYVAKEIDTLFSHIKGDEENYYEFETMQKTDEWGRNAKWLTEKGKNMLISDMNSVKMKIYEISKKCSGN